MQREKDYLVDEAARREKCFREIDEMSFAKRCQCYVDHRTALSLSKSGFGLKPILRVRGEPKPSIQKLIGWPKYWVQFFLENTPKSFWKDFLLPQEYAVWFKYYLCGEKRPAKVIAKAGKTDWHKWVYGGHRNPILDRPWRPKPGIEMRGFKTYH